MIKIIRDEKQTRPVFKIKRFHDKSIEFPLKRAESGIEGLFQFLEQYFFTSGKNFVFELRSYYLVVVVFCKL